MQPRALSADLYLEYQHCPMATQSPGKAMTPATFTALVVMACPVVSLVYSGHKQESRQGIL